MNEILNQFKVILSLDSSPLDKGLSKTQTSLKKFALTATKVLVAALSIKVLKDSISAFNKLNLEVGRASSLLGLSSESVSALGGALKRFGGGVGSASSSLGSLNTALQEAKFGSGALIEVSKRYGVSFQKSNGQLMNSYELLKSLTTQFKRFDTSTQVSIGKGLGLDDSTIQLLQSGTKNFDRLIARQREFGLVSQKDTKISNEFNEQILDIKDAFAGFAKDFIRLILPVLTKLLSYISKFIQFIKRHKMVLIGMFGAIVVAIAPLLASFGALAISVAVAFAPIIAVVAVLTAIGIIVEDIWGYFNGMDSVTGDLVKKFPFLKNIIDLIVAPVIIIKEAFNAIMKWIENPTWDNFKKVFIEAGKNILKWVKEPLENVFGVITKIADWINGKIMDGFKKIGSFIGFGSDEAETISKNSSTSQITNNINASINQNIASSTPKALADQTGQMLINSINTQRYNIGVGGVSK